MTKQTQGSTRGAKEKLKIGVVGVGALGRHHARILSEMAEVELVAVAETNAEQGQRIAEQCGTRWVSSYHEMLDDVNAVSIVVPTQAHLLVAAEFLSRGIPVMVEKPLAATVAQAEELMNLADEHDTILQVGHIERFNPATSVAWNLAGTPKYIRAERVSPYAFRSMDIGVIHDLMIHDIDLVLDLVKSPVKSVEAFGICLMGGHEDTVQARVHFQNGCIADLVANRVSPEPSRKMQIWSDKGCLSVDFQTRTITNFHPGQELFAGSSVSELSREPGANIDQLKQEVFGRFIKSAHPPVPVWDALTEELSHFVDCVNNNRQPVCSGREGLAAMQLAGEVLDAVETHQWEGQLHGITGPHLHQPIRRVA